VTDLEESVALWKQLGSNIDRLEVASGEASCRPGTHIRNEVGIETSRANFASNILPKELASTSKPSQPTKGGYTVKGEYIVGKRSRKKGFRGIE